VIMIAGVKQRRVWVPAATTVQLRDTRSSSGQ
jgi:hypothetical protein